MFVTVRIKWFDPIRGFGFIVDDAGGPDVFVHWSALPPMPRPRTIAPGAHVEFGVTDDGTGRGPKAINVVPIE